MKVWVALAVEERAARGRGELDDSTIIVAAALSPDAARRALQGKVREVVDVGEELSEDAIADDFVIVEPIEAEVA